MDWKTMQPYFEEEVADAKKYKALASKTEGGDRQMLDDMAKEEYTHAKHLCQIMKEHGESVKSHEEQLKILRNDIF